MRLFFDFFHKTLFVFFQYCFRKLKYDVIVKQLYKCYYYIVRCAPTTYEEVIYDSTEDCRNHFTREKKT